jgi:hypothetical protein
MPKTIREKIGIMAGPLLPHQGLTLREWSAKKRWEGLPEAEKETRRLKAKALGLKMTELRRTGKEVVACS